VVREGRVEVADRIKICVTFDHRLMDGVMAAKMRSCPTLGRLWSVLMHSIKFPQSCVSGQAGGVRD
jgi:hypothetical protein